MCGDNIKICLGCLFLNIVKAYNFLPTQRKSTSTSYIAHEPFRNHLFAASSFRRSQIAREVDYRTWELFALNNDILCGDTYCIHDYIP